MLSPSRIHKHCSNNSNSKEIDDIYHPEIRSSERDDLGRFVEGNSQGIISSEEARRLQLLSAKKRAQNRKLSHEIALMTADCELQGFDEQTIQLVILMVRALRGDLAAAVEVGRSLGFLKCENCRRQRI